MTSNKATVFSLLLALFAVSCRSTTLPSDGAARMASPSASSGLTTPDVITGQNTQENERPAAIQLAESKRDTWWGQCSQRMKQASDNEKLKDAQRWCERNEPAAAAYPFENATFHRTTAEEALAWWPYDPVLRASSLMASGEMREFWYGWAPDGRGMEADPETESSSLLVLYAPGSADPRTQSRGQLRDSGGVLISVFYAPQPAKPFGPYGPVAPVASLVTVRGNPAHYHVERGSRSTSADDFHIVFWDRPLGDKGNLTFAVQAHPRHFSKSELLNLVDGLTEAR